MQPKPLNRIDVSHRKPTDPGVQWLINNGYRLCMENDRVFLERRIGKGRRRD